jgi:hypothetical protein
MGRILFGLVLMPTSVLTSWAAARALGLLAARSSSALPFLAGLALSPALWLAGRAAEREGAAAAGWLAGLQRRVYVFGHELTHALAAWWVGG